MARNSEPAPGLEFGSVLSSKQHRPIEGPMPQPSQLPHTMIP